MVYVYIPVTITNSESTATSTDFQQLVTVDLSYYSAFLNQDLSNTFFSSDTAGTPSNFPYYNTTTYEDLL